MVFTIAKAGQSMEKLAGNGGTPPDIPLPATLEGTAFSASNKLVPVANPSCSSTLVATGGNDDDGRLVVGVGRAPAAGGGSKGTTTRSSRRRSAASVSVLVILSRLAMAQRLLF